MKIVDVREHPNNTVPRDGWGRPLIVPKEGGTPKGHTRVTTFIDCVEDKAALSDWSCRMTAVGLAQSPGLLNRVRQLDPETDKRALDALVRQAKDQAGASAKASRGTHLHALTERADQGKPLPAWASDEDLDDMAAYMVATAALEVMAVEQFVVVGELGAAGTLDRIVQYEGPGPDGEPISGQFIADVKTGRVDYGALKMAAQLAVYAHGELYDYARFPVDTQDAKAFAAWKKTLHDADAASSAYSELGPINQDWGVIIHLPAGEARCALHWVDLRIGWELALLAQRIREARGTKGAMLPWGQVAAPRLDNAGALP